MGPESEEEGEHVFAPRAFWSGLHVLPSSGPGPEAGADLWNGLSIQLALRTSSPVNGGGNRDQREFREESSLPQEQQPPVLGTAC